MVATALFSLAVAFSSFALARAAAPWPTAPIGDVLNAGSQCNVTWKAATDSVWNPMSLNLMTGPNLDMVFLKIIATNVDGTQDGTVFFKCPEVDINADIYFIQFNSSQPDVSKVSPVWTTRFTIASDKGATVAAPNAAQPDGSPPAWGTGHLVSTGSSSSSSSSSSPTPNGSSPTSSGSQSSSTSPSGTSSSDLSSGTPPSGNSSGSNSNNAEPTITSTSTVSVTTTATRFTTKYSFVTVSASPSVVTTTTTATPSVVTTTKTSTVTATSTSTVTASPTSSSGSTTPSSKVATVPAKSAALRKADLPVMHLLAFAVGSATAFITLLA